MQSRDCIAAIIPLGRDSHHGSSSLPEGLQFRSAYANLNAARSGKTETQLNEPGRLSPPIWLCTTRGFPCLVCRQTSGGLLPHRFTLTCAISFETSCRFPCSMPPCSISPAVYFLWHFPSARLSAGCPRVSLRAIGIASELRGIAPCSVRTFLPRLAPGAILRPSKIGLKIGDRTAKNGP